MAACPCGKYVVLWWTLASLVQDRISLAIFQWTQIQDVIVANRVYEMAVERGGFEVLSLMEKGF